MGVSLNWLKEYIDYDWSPEELAHRLTMAGIAIEGVEEEGDDYIMDLDLTPNRGDCLGMINLAREIAALNGNTIKIAPVSLKENGEKIEDYITVELADPDLCRRYAARLVKHVVIKDSPDWMQKALINSGIRPINNIVDITNYVMLETNQPLHAFDYHLLQGKNKKIVVRRAQAGEKFVTLDENERILDSEMLVITDSKRAIALAGVMGGYNTEIKDDTSDVLIESAWFLGPNIRRTSRRLALRTDSSQRFEKGADINGVIYAVNRAAALMQELAGGEVVGGICDAYPNPEPNRVISLRPDRVNSLLGTQISTGEIKSFLQSLTFPIEESGGVLKVEAPSYRPDITMEVDLIEEVARLYGYDKIDAVLPVGNTTQGGLNAIQKFRDRIRAVMAGNLFEVVTYSFINPVHLDNLRLLEDAVERNFVVVANPLSEEQGIMRTTLLPGLLDTAATNLARKNENLAFFEMGAVFYTSDGRLPQESVRLGAIVTGSNDMNWLQNKVNLDFYYLKGVAEDLLRQLNIYDYAFEPVQSESYHPGRTARVMSGTTVLGIIGEVHPLVLQNYDIKPRCCAMELDVEALYACSQDRVMMQEITRYPAVERDMAILVEVSRQASEVLAVIKEAGNEYLRRVVVFDVYTGEQVPAGYKSMAFRFLFQAPDRTLTDTEINESMADIQKNLESKLKAARR
ncbi:MAG: phenylalanine--tRNA ligase subunit beta [Deltaproteobacteria bacterium]